MNTQMDFPILLPSQLREHLRALRKARGLTQAALGQLLGVGQARVAEIESNPGVVSVDQLMKVLSLLQVSLVLRDDESTKQVVARQNKSSESLRQPTVGLPPTGQKEPVLPTYEGRQSVTPGLNSGKRNTVKYDVRVLPDANSHADVTSPVRRNFIFRAKKGSW